MTLNPTKLRLTPFSQSAFRVVYRHRPQTVLWGWDRDNRSQILEKEIKESKPTPTGIRKGPGRYPPIPSMSSMRGNLGADLCHAQLGLWLIVSMAGAFKIRMAIHMKQ